MKSLLLGLGLPLLGCQDDLTGPQSPEISSAVSAVAPRLVQLNAGGQHTCGVSGTGQAYCWGQNSSGELGNGSTVSSSRPVLVSGGHVFRQISAGISHTCALTTDNRLYCWGEPSKIGIASPPVSTPTPVLVAPSLRFQSVSAGANHTCAITVSDRRAYCWGVNDAGGLGDGTTTRRATPVRVVGNQAWRQVTVGNLFTCGITTTNIAWCWGTDLRGALGDGPEAQRKLTPVLVAGDHRFIQIGAGEFHTCAVTTTKRAWCWGSGFGGAIGDGKTLDRYTPRAVAGGHTFDRVAAGIDHSCAESTTNDAYCWGGNSFGQVGNGSTSGGVTQPSLVVGGFHFVQLDADGNHVCGRNSDAVVRCWGYNNSGQLGDGTTTHRSRPTLIVGG